MLRRLVCYTKLSLPRRACISSRLVSGITLVAISNRSWQYICIVCAAVPVAAYIKDTLQFCSSVCWQCLFIILLTFSWLNLFCWSMSLLLLNFLLNFLVVACQSSFVVTFFEVCNWFVVIVVVVVSCLEFWFYDIEFFGVRNVTPPLTALYSSTLLQVKNLRRLFCFLLKPCTMLLVPWPLRLSVKQAA